MDTQRKYGRGGWPLVPSTRFQGETTLACPVCWATNVIMSCRYPVRGSGPNGRGRLGDYGTVETNQCGNCGHFASFDAATARPVRECHGHPAGTNGPMGQTVYCDGSCARPAAQGGD